MRNIGGRTTEAELLVQTLDLVGQKSLSDDDNYPPVFATTKTIPGKETNLCDSNYLKVTQKVKEAI